MANALRSSGDLQGGDRAGERSDCHRRLSRSHQKDARVPWGGDLQFLAEQIDVMNATSICLGAKEIKELIGSQITGNHAGRKKESTEQ